MSRIHIRRQHDLTRAAARGKVDRVAEVLTRRFDAECRWQGDTLEVKHAQVSGRITLGERDVVVEARLGPLLAMFSGRVDEELIRVLDREFPQA